MSYDRLARIACRMANATAAFIAVDHGDEGDCRIGYVGCRPTSDATACLKRGFVRQVVYADAFLSVDPSTEDATISVDSDSDEPLVGLTGAPIRNARGEPVGAVVVLHTSPPDGSLVEAALADVAELAGQHLDKRQEPFRDLFDSIPVMIVVTSDRDGDPYIVDCNRAFLETLGYARSDVLSRPLASFYTTESARELRENGYRKAMSGGLEAADRRFVAADGREIDVLLRRTMRGDNDETVGIYVDISDRKRIEAELSENEVRFRTIVDSSGDMVYVLDRDARFIGLYGANIQKFGFSPSLYLNKHVGDIIGAQNAQLHDDAFAQALSGALTVYESSIETHAGTRSFQTMLSPLRNVSGEIIGAVGVSRDITTLTEAKEAIRALNRDLERRVEQRTRELDAANIELTRTNANLHQFAYITSHDLHEPLRTVATHLIRLRRAADVALDSKMKVSIDFALDGATRMRERLNALAQYAKVGSVNQPFKTVETGPLVASVLRALDARLNETHPVMTVDEPLPSVVGNAAELHEVFLNLITNAVKFSGGSPPRIEISAERIDAHWRFSVRDEGIGIDPTFSDRIFGVFERLHHPDEIEGTGIGLAICRKIVDRHRGQIWVESARDAGSTFRFTLPAAD
ncbi:MAG: PAS domain S-box protein [Candidatus Poribacteria bacterium]|nr:PAS domain S-box protein [Candidatus Poribacteria bacterium]